MSKVSEKGFLFIHSGVFDNNQVRLNLETCIAKLRQLNENIRNCDVYVNVVENKEGIKYGHTYAWVSNDAVYNALIGLNFDGTERYEEKEDENWVEPEEDYDEAMERAGDNWALIGEIEQLYECPMIKVPLEPLVVPPGIKYTPEQQKELGTDEQYGFIEIGPARVTIRHEENKINALYSTCVPSWVNEQMLRNFFSKFSRDKSVHSKNKEKITFPLVSITKSNFKAKWRKSEDEPSLNVQITFSPLDRYLAYFLINVTKKIKLLNPNTKKEEILFFSHAKSRTNI